MKMFNGVVILLFLSYFVNCNQFDEMIEDEKQKILSESRNVWRKVYRGRILIIRPELTAQETDKIDILMAQSFRIGDPFRPLPDNHQKLEQELCQEHRDRSERILDYYRKKYTTRLVMRLAIRLSINETNSLNDYYCRDRKTRDYFIRNAKLVNQRINELKAIREEFVNILSYFINGFGKSFSSLLCNYRKYVKHTLSVMPSPELKSFVENMMESYFGTSLEYVSSFRTKGYETCDLNTHLNEESGHNTRVEKSESVQKPLFEAIFLSLFCNSEIIRC